MKTTQVLALGAMLVAQTQACTKVHVETWRDGNGADQVEVLVFRDNDPMRTMERIADGETSLRFKDPANFLTQVSLTAVGVPKGSKGGRRIKGTFSFENFDTLDLTQQSPEGAVDVDGHGVYCLWDGVGCGGDCGL